MSNSQTGEWVPCTSESLRKKHWALPSRLTVSRYQEGLSGPAACGSTVIDQARADHIARMWRGKEHAVDITTLPECGLCARSMRKRNTTA